MGEEAALGVCLRVAGVGGLGGTINCGVEGDGGMERVVWAEKDEEVPLLASTVTERGLPQPYKL